MQETRLRRRLETSWDWLEFAASLPARALPVPAGGGSGLVASGRVVLTGWSVTSSATVAGTVNVLDGQDAKGALVDPGTIAASGSLFRAYSPRGLLCENGVFLQVTGAVLSGAVYVVELWHYPFTPPDE